MCKLFFQDVGAARGQRQSGQPVIEGPSARYQESTAGSERQTVCAGLPSGGFADEAIVDAANVFRIP